MDQSVKEYKCPCCSGAIEFDTSLQKMKCPYCDTEFEIETLQNFAADLDEEIDDDMQFDTESEEMADEDGDQLATFICNSCAGEIITDVNTAAAFCPYCGNPVVMAGKVSGALKPDLVIPFKYDKEQAVNAFSNHLTGKKLLPKVFKDQNHINDIKGIYVPFWLYDADADATIRYRAQKIRTWSDYNYRYTETSHFSLLRKGTMSFDHVPVDGSESMPDDLMESIEPFDYSEAVDFNTAFLSGFFADKYDVSGEDCQARANERIKNSTELTFAQTTQSYAAVTAEHSSVVLNNGKRLYALLPVWVMQTEWNGQQYLFAMNGQTGKFVGNLPCDKATSRKYFWGITAAVTAGISLLSYLIYLL